MKTIIWDVDDVLNHLMLDWFEKKWKIDKPDCSLTYSELCENPPYKILGIEKQIYLRSLDEFRLSEHFLNMKPNEEIFNWFRQYGHYYRHIALTATPIHTAHMSAYWVMKHFGNWVRTFHCIPSPRSNQYDATYDQSKAEYIRWLEKGDILIEDNERNVREAKMLGLDTYLIAQPWNKDGKSVNEILCEIMKGVNKND